MVVLKHVIPSGNGAQAAGQGTKGSGTSGTSGQSS
jgi:hypothetical protein